VLDQALRVLNAMVDLAADEGVLGPALHCMRFTQLLVQATLPDQTELAQLPGLSAHQAAQAEATLRSQSPGVGGVAGLVALYRHKDRGGAATLLAAAGASGKAVEALEALPVASFAVAGLKEDSAADDTGSSEGGNGGAAAVALSVAANADCTVAVDLSFGPVVGAAPRNGKPPPQGQGRPGERFRVRTPFYPKAKELGWWLALGAGDELLALKRINHTHSQRVTLSFAAPEVGGAHTLDLWLVADSIRGLDVHLPVPLFVVE
jgi:activating signal cointegrator complex subunit 3